MNERIQRDDVVVTVRQYMTVCETPKWLLGSKNVAIATAVTEDGRVVEGIGSSRWSTSTAEERAVEHVKSLATEVPFSLRISKVRVGSSNATFERVDDGRFRKSGINPIGGSTKVWITADDGSHEVSASGKTYLNYSKLRRALGKAIDAADSEFDRVVDLTGPP